MGSKAKNRLGTALEVTGGIVSSVGAFPGSGIIGGALSLGGKMLKPGAATKEDVRELQQAIDQSQGIVKKLLEEKLAEMMRMLESGEMFRSDWANVKTEMMQILREVRVDNGKMASEVEIIKNVAAATYKMVESLRYKVDMRVHRFIDIYIEQFCRRGLRQSMVPTRCFLDSPI